MKQADFRAGLARLTALGLSLDAWVFHPQLGDAIDLARACPDARIVVGHCGGPLGYGPYTGKRDEVVQTWKTGITELARCPNVTMKLGGMESRGTVTYAMELGGLWLVGNVERDAGGSKFSGRGFDTFDAAKKKYVAVWVDSTSTRPTTMEGTHDAATKTTTMTGEGPGMDGKPVKYKSVSVWKDDNTVVYSMYVGDDKDPVLTITYTRKK